MNIVEYVTSIGGIASSEDLRAARFTTASAQYAVNSGRLVRLRRGWVATGAAPLDASRAVRVGGSLTCVSALRQYGVWCVDDPLLHVRVGAHTNHLATPASRGEPLSDPAAQGVRVHRTVGGVVVSASSHTDSVEIAFVHAVGCQPRDYAVALCDSILNKRLVSRARLQRLVHPLSARYRQVVALSNAAADSGLETKARLRLRALGIPYRVQAYIRGVGHVDLLIGDRLVLELDGREWHAAPVAFAEDRRRDLILHERGYVVVRLTYAQTIFQWERAERLIRAMVARRRHLWGSANGADRDSARVRAGDEARRWPSGGESIGRRK